MKTWMCESWTMYMLLALTAWVMESSPWTVVPVMLTFAHAQVSNRLREGVEAGKPVVCSAWLDRYWLLKEGAWLVLFASSGLWPAVVGCLAFSAYPFWRKAWRTWHPVQPSSPNEELIRLRVEAIRARLAKLEGSLTVKDGQLYIPQTGMYFEGTVGDSPDEWDDHILSAQDDIQFLLDLLEKPHA